MISSERSLGETARAVYPVNLEDMIEVNGQTITIRPAKTVMSAVSGSIITAWKKMTSTCVFSTPKKAFPLAMWRP